MSLAIASGRRWPVGGRFEIDAGERINWETTHLGPVDDEGSLSVISGKSPGRYLFDGSGHPPGQ